MATKIPMNIELIGGPEDGKIVKKTYIPATATDEDLFTIYGHDCLYWINWGEQRAIYLYSLNVRKKQHGK